MNIKKFKEISQVLLATTKIKVSFFTYNYTKKHTEVAYNSTIDYVLGEGLELTEHTCSEQCSTIRDLNKLIIEKNIPDNEELISWDSDDGNIFGYGKYIITDDSIILCVE
jgi:hypothetical protein